MTIFKGLITQHLVALRLRGLHRYAKMLEIAFECTTMSMTPDSAADKKNPQLAADLAAAWSSQQEKANLSIAVQDLELRDKLVGSLTRFVINEKTEHELSRASMTFLGRISDLISTGSFEVEKKLNTAKKAIQVLLKDDALEGLDASRLEDIMQGVSVVPGVLNKEEWVAARLNAPDPFAADPGFVFDLDHDAISSAVEGYVSEIQAGSEAMPDYQGLCQKIQFAKLKYAAHWELLKLSVESRPSSEQNGEAPKNRRDFLSDDLGL